MIECRLDSDGLRLQRDRYRTLARQLESLDRAPGRLEARFGATVNRALLEETLAVERACCPFLTLDYDAGERRLLVTVERDADAALDALRDALTA